MTYISKFGLFIYLGDYIYERNLFKKGDYRCIFAIFGSFNFAVHRKKMRGVWASRDGHISLKSVRIYSIDNVYMDSHPRAARSPF